MTYESMTASFARVARRRRIQNATIVQHAWTQLLANKHFERPRG